MVSEYAVEMTETAEKTYRRLYEEAQECIEAGQTSNSKVTRFKMVEEAIDKLIPSDPFCPERSLSGPLSNIFRISKGRLRIFYIGSSKARRIIILFISERLRKQGDVNDPYSLFSRLVLSGKYNDLFEKLGVRPPDKRMSVSHSIQ